MDWASAAAYLTEQIPTLSDPPDDPRLDSDWAFWQAVEALVNSGGELQEFIAPARAGAQNIYREVLHPRGRHGQWIKKMDSIAAEAHEGQVDKLGVPYINHLRAVADSVSPQARGVAYFHDALEDTQMKPEDLKDVLDADEIEAVKLLTRDKTVPYQATVDRLKAAKGRAGELAREVKVADLQHNIGRIPALKDPKLQQRLRDKYEPALAQLAPGPAVLPHHGEAPANVEALNEKAVEGHLRGMYDAAVDGGHADDANWYQEEHDRIWALADKVGVDPQTLTAIVAATSPRQRWIWPKTGKMPNLEAAVAAVEMARRHPDESAPILATRLAEQSGAWSKQVRAAKKEGERLAGPRPEGPGMLAANLEKGMRLYRGEDPDRILSEPKTRSFYNNLVWPDKETTTTVDTLMARSVQGEVSRAGYGTTNLLDESAKGSGYQWVVQRLENVRQALADEGIHLKPQELQAIVWREQQRRQDAAEEAARNA
jgi:hypothetical protein